MEQGVNLLANFPLSWPFFSLTREICGRPRKHINFAGKPVLKIILFGNGWTQGYVTAHMKALSNRLLIEVFFKKSVTTRGGAHDLAKFRIPMIHRFMTSHPVAKLLLCFRAKYQDGRPMLFGFFVILTHRLTELCILNTENVEKVSSRPFKQMS